jgi:uncharacterized membrane protein
MRSVSSRRTGTQHRTWLVGIGALATPGVGPFIATSTWSRIVSGQRDPLRGQRRGTPELRGEGHGQFSRVLARNINGLVAARNEEERGRTTQERVSDAITRFAGSLRFVYIHAFVFGAWIIWNLGWIPGLPLFDPSFVVLAMTASVEAIFLSTFVLITQNRMQALAEKRAELDLQISLLAEHEITQLTTLVDAIARHLGVEHTPNADIEEVKQDVDPRAVLKAIEEESKGGSGG